ncbi:MAG: hypothetical protein R2731_08495 [Nocardioides sp.]
MTDLPLLGFGLPVSGSWATPATMLHLAQRAEALGYASLWTFQRTLVPVGGSAASHDAVGRPAARAVDAPAYQAVQDAVLPSRSWPRAPSGSGSAPPPCAPRSPHRRCWPRR